MTTARPISVFVSSTSEDLSNYRAAARLVIMDLGWQPVMMEHFGALPNPTVEACREKLRQCDVMLLLVAFRRGWVPTPEQGGNGTDSVTALELAFARQRQIPVLALFASETWPGNKWEQEQAAREWIRKFRAEINLPAAFFDFEQDTLSSRDSERLPCFRAKVRETLVLQRERMRTAPADAGVDYFARACSEIADGSGIPFLGLGVYGEGPLSIASLAGALDPPPRADQNCVATAGEYCERYLDSRAGFLKRLGQVIEEQARQLPEVPPVYRLMLKAKPPRLIVSTTCDWVLEQQLEDDGRPYAVVSHVMRSRAGEHDGKILVWQDKKAEFCLATKLELKDGVSVIYKPLGSPFLHRWLDPDLEIDTVVVTETDHLLFLSRLDNDCTGVPTRFTRLLQRFPLVFLGYALDIWQYRLVMQVFRSVGILGGHFSSLAVRNPASTMERLAWQRLGSSMVHLELNDFVQRVDSSLVPDNVPSGHAQ